MAEIDLITVDLPDAQPAPQLPLLRWLLLKRASESEAILNQRRRCGAVTQPAQRGPLRPTRLVGNSGTHPGSSTTVHRARSFPYPWLTDPGTLHSDLSVRRLLLRDIPLWLLNKLTLFDRRHHRDILPLLRGTPRGSRKQIRYPAGLG